MAAGAAAAAAARTRPARAGAEPAEQLPPRAAFYPATQLSGQMPGFTYGVGAQGMGYYRDDHEGGYGASGAAGGTGAALGFGIPAEQQQRPSAHHHRRGSVEVARVGGGASSSLALLAVSHSAEDLAAIAAAEERDALAMRQQVPIAHIPSCRPCDAAQPHLPPTSAAAVETGREAVPRRPATGSPY